MNYKLLATHDTQEVVPEYQLAMCELHGQFSQRVTQLYGRKFKGRCPGCEKKRRTELEIKARENERWALEDKLGAAMIPTRFKNKTFMSYVADTQAKTMVLNKAREYAKNFNEYAREGRGMLLLGKPGTGKTHLAAAIGNEIMAKSSATVVYRTLSSVLKTIRGTYGLNSDQGQSESKILNSLILPTLLILDEIGISKNSSDFELTTLFSIINGRYEELRPTVIVSNCDAKALPAAIGERCADRLREGGVTVLPFNWESHRGLTGRNARGEI